MSDRSSRFLNLERDRQAAKDAPVSPTHERFGAIEESRPNAPLPAAVDARFAPPREREPVLDLHQKRPEDQPFVRCAHCEADSHAFATACAHCGASLNTPEQRAFNEKLWQARKEEAAREAQALAELNAKRTVAEREQLGAQRQMAEQLAADVARSTRNRLEMEELRDLRGFGGFGRRGRLEDYASRRLFAALPYALKKLFLYVGFGVPLVLMLIPKTRMLGFIALLGFTAFYVRTFWSSR